LLALGLALGAMWVRGGSVSDTVRYKVGFGGLTVHGFSGGGSLAVAVTRGVEFFKDPFKRLDHARSTPPIDFHRRWANLGGETRYNANGVVLIREPSRGTVGGVLIPCGPVAGGLVVLAGVRYIAWRAWGRRRRRAGAGLCPDCGHDMSTFVDRCPDCGRTRTRGMFRIRRPRADDFRRAA
jgi:hypothetical protein